MEKLTEINTFQKNDSIIYHIFIRIGFGCKSDIAIFAWSHLKLRLQSLKDTHEDTNQWTRLKLFVKTSFYRLVESWVEIKDIRSSDY